MTASIRESILAAIATALDNIDGVDDRVYRSRTEPVIRMDTPAILIEPVRDSAEQPVCSYIMWNLLVRINVISRGDIPDQVVDTVVADVHAALASNNLGGLCLDVQAVGTNFEMIDGDQPIGIIASDFQIMYRTKDNDLTSAN